MMLRRAMVYLGERPLRTKLMLLFAGLFTLLCLFISLAVYVAASRTALAQIRFSATQSFAQGLAFVENKVQAALYASELILSNKDVQRILEEGARTSPADPGDEYRAMQKAWNLLLSLQAKDVFNACLFVGDAFTYGAQGVNFGRFSDLKDNPRYGVLLASGGQPVWLPPMDIQVEKNLERVICLMRVTLAQEDYGEVIGAQRVGVLAESIDEILRKASITETSLTYLINSTGELVSTSAPSRTFAYADVALPASSAEDWETIDQQGLSYLVKAEPVALTDWRMVSLVPTEDFQRLGQQFVPTLIAWLLPLLATAIVLIWVIASSVTRRVSMLAERMTHGVASGDLTVRVPEGVQDEIGQLCGAFNAMVEDLQQLSQARYEQGKAIKQAELRALQAQINPHFLYNTLDLMNWMALDHQVPELAEMTRAMARFYRLSLGRGRDFVRLSEEIAHVETYVQIQSRRFAGRISLVLDVPEPVAELEVLKLLLQPLVENAIQHGLDCAGGKEAVHIAVSARPEDADLIIAVQDDGIGMTDEALAGLLAGDPEKQHGYGVRNIHMRLRLCYGEGYGLSCESELGKGTRVTLRMPARRMRR